MTRVQWYYAQGDNQVGPVSSAQMRQLASAGALQPDDLVWREGIEEWTEARNVKGLFPYPGNSGTLSRASETFSGSAETEARIPEMVSTPPVSTPLGTPKTAFDSQRSPHARRHLFDFVLAIVRVQFPAQFVDTTAKIFALFGHYGLYVAMLVYFLFSLIAGFQKESLDSIQLGCGVVLVLAVLQYSASRAWNAIDRVSRASTGSISSLVVPDCLALACMSAGIMVLISRALTAVAVDNYWLVLSGLSAFILFECLAFISLNPEALNVAVVADTRAETEAVGVFCFLLKSGLRLVPVAFGVGVVAGIIRLLYPCYLLFGEQDLIANAAMPPPLRAEMQMQLAEATAFEAIRSVTFYAVLPAMAYIVFLPCSLLMELIHVWLPGPSKPDTPAGTGEA